MTTFNLHLNCDGIGIMLAFGCASEDWLCCAVLCHLKQMQSLRLDTDIAPILKKQFLKFEQSLNLTHFSLVSKAPAPAFGGFGAAPTPAPAFGAQPG